MHHIKESQKAYLTKSNIILVGSVCILGNVLLLLSITDLFSENPFVHENMMVLFLMASSIITFFAMFKKHKEYNKQ
jgi:hypothetical protein